MRLTCVEGVVAEASGDDLTQLEKELINAVGEAADLASLEEVRVSALGKKGRVSELMKGLGKLAPEDRKSFGQAVNGVKQRVNDALQLRKEALASAALAERLASETADVTLPVRRGPTQEGRIHPVSQVMDEIAEIFASMGFDIAEGPDIETDENNFTKLNIPPEHPARQEQDTFYLPEDKDGQRKVLRTHTSAVQIRAMEAGPPPYRMVAPGRVYRSDYDQTHTPQFHQIEGLVVDKDIHFGHLKWVLEEFFKAFFEIDDVKVRFRANYFPFTEPSMEADIGAEFLGQGEDSWLEILGCGMVHPNVLRNVGVDPEKYQGFAFGIGIDRLTMLKYGLPDLRDFFGGDQRWLKHYGIAPLSVPTVAGGLSS